MLAQLCQDILQWLQSLFFQHEMELTVLGLGNAGKSTLVNVLANGEFSEDRKPTVGFNMRRVSKGKVCLKIWDLAGQTHFRKMWLRYCRGVDAIVYVLDAADKEKFELNRDELHEILGRSELDGIPVLILANKCDLPGALRDADQITKTFRLSDIKKHNVSIYSVSCKEKVNIDITLSWLIDTSNAKQKALEVARAVEAAAKVGSDARLTALQRKA